MSTDNILAVVGSQEFVNDSTATRAATEYLIMYYEKQFSTINKVISGGAKGIDKLAISLARNIFNFPTKEYLPVNLWWEPNGYKDRNIQIVEACSTLLCIRHHRARTYGSGWTADYAERTRVPVVRLMYQSNGELEVL